MTGKKPRKRSAQEQPKPASRKGGRRKKRNTGDGSLFLVLLCVVLSGTAIFFLKDFYTVNRHREGDNIAADEAEAVLGDSGSSSEIPAAVRDSDSGKAAGGTDSGSLPQKPQPAVKPQRPQSPEKKPGAEPVLCFVIDDVGNNIEDLERFLMVPGKVTFAVLPGLPDSRAASERIRAAGQELLLHLPMEAVSGVYPGPGLLTESMSDEERWRCLNGNLESVPGAVGVNNHMGSKGTSSLELSLWLLRALKRKNLFFLDSRTIAGSQMRQAAEIENWKILERNSMFLDNEKDIESLTAAIEAGKTTAREKGHAVMIGHAVTSELADLMMKYYPALTEEGFVIENLTYLLNEAREKHESIGD